MAKTVSGATGERWDDYVGGWVPIGFASHTVTRAMRKSTHKEIPWSRGPQTRGERIRRALIG